MIEKQMDFLAGTYSWAGYTYQLARELGGYGFYSVREATPLFCFYGATQADVIDKARNAIEFYQGRKSEPAQSEENHMRIVTVVDDAGDFHGCAVVVSSSTMQAGFPPQCEVVAEFLLSNEGVARAWCEGFIEGYNARASIETETAS